MDDKPLPNVRVTFEPVAPEEGNDGEFFGPTSQAKTDSEGWYSLMVPTTGQDGAVVGQHVVRIYPVDDDEGKDTDELVDKEIIFIPARYNDESALRATVPEAGTSSANYQLTSEKDETDYDE